MKTFYKTLFIAAAPFFLLSSCSEDETALDTVKPEIMLATPGDHAEFEFGETIQLQAILKDNVELGSYKIEIHNDSDGHQHRSATIGWSFMDTGDVSNQKEYLLNKTIPIPTGDYTEGHYHLGIIVTDKAGNETQSFIEIVIGEDHHH